MINVQSLSDEFPSYIPGNAAEKAAMEVLGFKSNVSEEQMVAMRLLVGNVEATLTATPEPELMPEIEYAQTGGNKTLTLKWVRPVASLKVDNDQA